MDRLHDYLPVVVLLVLALPFGFALLLALSGRAARRLAPVFSVLHIGVTAALVFLGANVLTDQSATQTVEGRIGFHPHFVPGAFQDTTPGVGRTDATTWNIFTLAPANERLPAAAVQFFVGIDGLNLWLIALASIMGYVAVLVSPKSAAERPGAYYAWLFTLLGFVIGAFLSFDILLFYFFFELTLVPSFFLIGGWGVGGGKRDAARKFFLYTLFGGLLTLTGIIGLVMTNPTPVVKLEPKGGKPALLRTVGPSDVVSNLGLPPVTPTAGPVSFSIPQLMRNAETWVQSYRVQADKLSDQAAAAPASESLAVAAKKATEDRDRHMNLQMWLFFALVAGFVVKVPLVPFHTWLPAAYAEAPAAVTLLMSALMAKLGTLGLLRVALPLCPDAAVEYGLPVFGFLGAVGIVYAALCAYAQRDLKLVAAYSSISHLGLLVLGLFALNTEGLTGATLHMVNHGLSAGAMFALVAFLADRYKTTDTAAFGGLNGVFPRYAFFTFVIAFASVGLPGLNNFVSEMMLIASVITPGNTYLVGYGLALTACVGVFLSAWYLFTVLRKVFFGPVRLPVNADSPPKDANGRELAAFALPAMLCLLLGVYPQPVIDTMKNDVRSVMDRLDQARQRQYPESYALEERKAEIANRRTSTPLPPGQPLPDERPVGPPPAPNKK